MRDRPLHSLPPTMARTKQTARKATGAPAPRLDLPAVTQITSVVSVDTGTKKAKLTVRIPKPKASEEEVVKKRKNGENNQVCWL